MKHDRHQGTAAETTTKKTGIRCRNLKKVKSQPVVERKNCWKYQEAMPKILTSMCGWLRLQKACHITELLQKCIKYAKIYLDSFLTVTTVFENWMLL